MQAEELERDMELNTRERYAVMAMTELARHPAGEAVSLSQLAENQQLSNAYLEQLFARLRQAGLVESVRGRTGGYRLARSAGEISVADVMRAVGEEIEMRRCAADGHRDGCVGNARCLTHDLWFALGQHINSFIDQVTLADVITRSGLLAPHRERIPAAGSSVVADGSSSEHSRNAQPDVRDAGHNAGRYAGVRG